MAVSNNSNILETVESSNVDVALIVITSLLLIDPDSTLSPFLTKIFSLNNEKNSNNIYKIIEDNFGTHKLEFFLLF